MRLLSFDSDLCPEEGQSIWLKRRQGYKPVHIARFAETLARTLKTAIQTFPQPTVVFISEFTDEDNCRLSKRLNCCFQCSG